MMNNFLKKKTVFDQSELDCIPYIKEEEYLSVFQNLDNRFKKLANKIVKLSL
jgi:hypothetical protein